MATYVKQNFENVLAKDMSVYVVSQNLRMNESKNLRRKFQKRSDKGKLMVRVQKKKTIAKIRVILRAYGFMLSHSNKMLRDPGSSTSVPGSVITNSITPGSKIRISRQIN